MSLAGQFFDLAIFLCCIAIAWIIGSYINGIYGYWGFVVGIIVALFELSILAYLRDWEIW